jgi:hypothetical protein
MLATVDGLKWFASVICISPSVMMYVGGKGGCQGFRGVEAMTSVVEHGSCMIKKKTPEGERALLSIVREGVCR